MLTRNKIMQAAFQSFGEHGYNGGSLAQIAEEVGIKKQSIYTYFKSKDALYLAISQQAVQFELAFAKDFIAQTAADMEQTLLPFLQGVQQRFHSSVETKFFIRSIYLMPQHLQGILCEQTNAYLDQLELLFINYFANQTITVSAEDAANSFLALLDSLYVEMLYGGNERFQKRLHAGWKVFIKGITN